MAREVHPRSVLGVAEVLGQEQPRRGAHAVTALCEQLVDDRDHLRLFVGRQVGRVMQGKRTEEGHLGKPGAVPALPQSQVVDEVRQARVKEVGVRLLAR